MYLLPRTSIDVLDLYMIYIIYYMTQLAPFKILDDLGVMSLKRHFIETVI